MPDRRTERPAHLQLLAISWNFGWPIAAGVVLGHWLDLKVGSSPALTLLMGLGAMVASIWRMIQLGRQEVREREQAEGHGDEGTDER